MTEHKRIVQSTDSATASGLGSHPNHSVQDNSGKPEGPSSTQPDDWLEQLTANFLDETNALMEELSELHTLRRLSLKRSMALVKRYQDIIVDLTGVKRIDPAVGAILARHRGGLRLGMRILPVDTAAALVDHSDTLSLENLRTLTPDVAELLGKHIGPLNLSIDYPLAAESAAALAHHASRLDIFCEFAPGAAEALSHHRGGIGLSLPLPVEDLRAFTTNSTALDLNVFCEIEPEIATVLGRHCGILDLALHTECTEDFAEAVSKQRGILRLRLYQSKPLALAAAKRLATHIGLLEVYLAEVTPTDYESVLSPVIDVLGRAVGAVRLYVSNKALLVDALRAAEAYPGLWRRTRSVNVAQITHDETKYQDYDGDGSVIDSKKTIVSEIVPHDGEKTAFRYTYDIGDDWEYEVSFECYSIPR